MKNIGQTVFKALAVAGIATAPVPAVAEDWNKVTFTQDGSARCEMSGGGPSSRGEMPTNFANVYWSNMACGQWERAKKILDDAPKASPERGIPSLLDNTSKLADCYRKSFPYGTTYHNIQIEGRGEERKVGVSHGFFGMSGEEFYKVQRAATAACDVKLGINLR